MSMSTRVNFPVARGRVARATSSKDLCNSLTLISRWFERPADGSSADLRYATSFGLVAATPFWIVLEGVHYCCCWEQQRSLNTTHSQSAGGNHRSVIFRNDTQSTITAQWSSGATTQLATTSMIALDLSSATTQPADHNSSSTRTSIRLNIRKVQWIFYPDVGYSVLYQPDEIYSNPDESYSNPDERYSESVFGIESVASYSEIYNQLMDISDASYSEKQNQSLCRYFDTRRSIPDVVVFINV
ncbi:hypothetical protein F511_31627 [Dorcoceras hygrometricum]|uniref:Uncharacterized protein n=1 Tax=Dorcoceras hygrometricum TaxID=472368 RepID=A0A2Z7D8J0_9LAMI|nr:hypothetical protein F511_31627 [Dorcoceras hygrometricum]